MASKASRVTQRIKEAVGQSNSQHRSNDLAVATQQYNAMRRNLSNLVKSLRNQHQALVALGKTRMEITRNVAMMSSRTPLYESAGRQATSENPSVCSYTTIQIAVAKNHDMLCEKFNQFVVSYAVEWERIVNTRISHSIKKAETLRRELDHYQQKVESLRQSVSSSLAKGKNLDPKNQDKLNRNEEKLSMSRKEYNQFASSLCLLIDEIVNRGWKDLHPLLVKMSQFDSTMSQSEANHLRSLNKIIDMLKVVGDKHDLKPEARLKELETLTAKQLYTGPEDAFVNADLIANEPYNKQTSYDQFSQENQFSQGNQFSHGGSQNQNLLDMGGPHPPSSNDWSNPINNQMSSLSVSDHRAPPHHRPPPPSSSQPFSNEFNLLDNSPAPAPAPSTRDMIDIAARSAPPPTFDMLNDHQNHQSHDRRGYNAAAAPGAPPPPPPRQIGMYPANGDGGGGGGYEPPRANEPRGGGGSGRGYDDYDQFDYSRTANGGTAGGGSSYNGGGYDQVNNSGPSRGGGNSYDQYFNQGGGGGGETYDRFDNKGGPPPSRGDGPSYDRFDSIASSGGGSYEPPSTSTQPPQRNDSYGFDSGPMGGSSMVPYDQERGYGGGGGPMGGQRSSGEPGQNSFGGPMGGSAPGGSNQNSFGGAMGGSAPGDSRQGQDWSSGPNQFGHGSASGPPVRPRPF